jgi:type II secretory pathway component GspD/PulD (secretin)
LTTPILTVRRANADAAEVPESRHRPQDAGREEPMHGTRRTTSPRFIASRTLGAPTMITAAIALGACLAVHAQAPATAPTNTNQAAPAGSAAPAPGQQPAAAPAAAGQAGAATPAPDAPQQPSPDATAAQPAPTGQAQGSPTLEAPADEPAEPAPPPTIEITPHGTVTLQAQGMDIVTLLELFSIKTQRNIVASEGVKGKVTVNLFDVPFDAALQAVLEVRGFASRQEGDFILVYTKKELAELDAARRQMVSRVFSLEYLGAQDAEAFAKPLMSEKGTMTVRGTVPRGMQPDFDDIGADDFALEAKLLVFDYVENVDRIAALIETLDVAPKQVRVECMVVETAIDDASAYGLDIAAAGSVDFGSVLDGPESIVDSLIGGPDNFEGANYPDQSQSGTVRNFQAPPSTSPNFQVGILGNHVSAFLQILDQVSDSNVLARPSVTCLNRQRARVNVGERVAYLSTTVNDNVSVQTVEFLDVGIQLMFRPFITDDGMIRLELSPSVSDYKLQNLTYGGDEYQVPNEFKQEVKTNVRVRDGQTVVLGGLFRETIISNRRQTPYVSDIPVLGDALTGQDDIVKKSEILFLVTPTLMGDEKSSAEGRAALQFTESVRVGARQGLLPFTREQLVFNHQIKAEEALRNGDAAKALHHAESALRQDSVLPAMMRIREGAAVGVPGGWREQMDLILQDAAIPQLHAEPPQQSMPGATPAPAKGATP